MAITDLTNTKWVLNDNLTIHEYDSWLYNINFTSNNTNYSTFKILGFNIVYTSSYNPVYIGDDMDPHISTTGTWTNNTYKTIQITGGEDVTNSSLIQWLEANATQVPVVDLSNTTWTINSITCPAAYGQFSVDFSILSQSIDEQAAIYIGYAFDRPNHPIATANSIYCLGSLTYLYVDDELEFTGGTDIANPDLIAWLSQNATYQEPTPTKTFDLSTLQLSAGTHEIKVRARASGYRDSNFSNSVSYVIAPPQWSCVVAGLGSENPSSVTFTHTGTMPTFEEVTVNSNVFIKIPKMYRKVLATSDNQITSFEIANYKKDNNFVPYTCFVKEDGTTEMDYVLIGKYFTNSNNVMNSVDTNTVSQSINNGRTNARALGSGYQLYDWQIHKLWQDLIICKKQTINTNSGSGIGTNNYDEFGIYWGTSGSWIDGVMGIYDSGYWMFSYKPSEYASDTVPNTYIQASYSQPTTGYTEIKKLGYDSSNPFFNYPSDIVSNSNYDTYYCDYYFKGSSKTVFCYVDHLSAATGAFYCYITSGSVNNQGARLCYRPISI